LRVFPDKEQAAAEIRSPKMDFPHYSFPLGSLQRGYGLLSKPIPVRPHSWPSRFFPFPSNHGTGCDQLVRQFFPAVVTRSSQHYCSHTRPQPSFLNRFYMPWTRFFSTPRLSVLPPFSYKGGLPGPFWSLLVLQTLSRPPCNDQRPCRFQRATAQAPGWNLSTTLFFASSVVFWSSYCQLRIFRPLQVVLFYHLWNRTHSDGLDAWFGLFCVLASLPHGQAPIPFTPCSLPNLQRLRRSRFLPEAWRPELFYPRDAVVPPLLLWSRSPTPEFSQPEELTPTAVVGAIHQLTILLHSDPFPIECFSLTCVPLRRSPPPREVGTTFF